MKYFLLLLVTLSADTSWASAIRLINQVDIGTSPMVEFRLHQETHQIARVGVHAGGTASVPTTVEYTAIAVVSEGRVPLTTNTVSFNSDSVDLIVEMKEDHDFHNLTLSQSPGRSPRAITIENTLHEPVQVSLTRPNSPFHIITVVDEHNQMVISTEQTWTVYAIWNGITTSTVSFTNPNAKITAVRKDHDSITLQVN